MRIGLPPNPREGEEKGNSYKKKIKADFRAKGKLLFRCRPGKGSMCAIGVIEVIEFLIKRFNVKPLVNRVMLATLARKGDGV